MKRVLVVEDDEATAFALRDGFQYEGYTVATASDGEAGLRMAKDGPYELILLDVMLPEMSGLDVCKRLRGAGNQTPIIMLTARGQEIDKVLGLRLGADDYVTKPFSFLELMARVEAVLRRSTGHEGGPEEVAFGDVTLNFTKMEATKSDRPLEVSPRELRILQYLIERKGHVVTRDELLDAVWGYTSFPFTRTVDMHIAKLRKKIEDNAHDPKYIITVHGIGYKFAG